MQDSQHDGSPKENAPDCPMTQPDADSGYEGSSNASLETHDDNRNASANPAVADGSSHSQPSSGTETDQPQPIRIRPIGKPIDIATARRASDVIEQMSQLLQEHMAKSRRRRLLSSKRNPPSMSIRPIMLGTTDQDAKTCLVIFCTDSHGSHDRIRDFLRKSFVKDLYQPNDATVPSFEVHIVGASPSTQAGVQVGIPLHPRLLDPNTTTLCGTSIYFIQENSAQKRLTTMGGILQLKSSDGTDGLFGLTAAHGAIHLTDLDDSDTSMSDEDDDDGDSSSEPTAVDAYPPAALVQIEWHSSLDPTAQDQAEHTELHSTEPVTEPIAFSALDDFQGGAFRDWALFPFPSKSIPPKRNMFATKPLKIPAALDNLDRRQYAAILTGTNEMKWKRIDFTPYLSRILLKPGTEFVRAYAINLPDGLDIRAGHSGSWVINLMTMEVYGHLVATDILMGAYIIPFVDVLNDIRARFQDVSIEFPSISSSYMPSTTPDLESFSQNMLFGSVTQKNGMIFHINESDDDGKSIARTISTASQTDLSPSVFSGGATSTSATFSSADTKGKYRNDFDLDRAYGSARPTTTTRPPLWGNSQLRKLSRLYAYTTLPVRKIIEVIYRKIPQWAPGLDSANQKLSAFFNKEPRWLPPRTEEDMKARLRELTQSNSRRNRDLHTPSHNPVPADMPIGEDRSSLASLIGQMLTRETITAGPDPSIQGILSEYSTDYVESVEMLMSRYSLLDISGGYLDFFAEPMSQVAVPTRDSWLHDASTPVTGTSAKIIAGDYLNLDHFLERQGFCGPGLARHSSRSCFCYARDEVTTDDWVTASGPTPNASGMLSSLAMTVTISTFSLADSFGNTVLHLLAARDTTREYLMRAIRLAPGSVLNMTNTASQTFLHVLGHCCFEDAASEDIALSTVLQELRLRRFDITARDVYGRNFFHLLNAAVADELATGDFLQPYDRHVIARRDAFGMIPTGTRSGPIPLLDQYAPTESLETSPETSPTRLLLGILTASSVPSLEDSYGRNGLHFLADAILSEETLQHNIELLAGVRSSKKATGESSTSHSVAHSLRERLSLRKVLVDDLLDAGVDPNHYDNDGNTVLMTFAARLPEDNESNSSCEIIRRLIEGGANINARNRSNETALHVAVRTGHNLAMRTLVEAGANVYARDGQGRSVLDVADAKIVRAKDVNSYARYEGARAWLSGIEGRAVQNPTVKQEWGIQRSGEA